MWPAFCYCYNGDDQLFPSSSGSGGGGGSGGSGGSGGGGGSGGSGSRTTCSSKGVVGWHWLRGSSDDNNGVSGGGVRGGGL